MTFAPWPTARLVIEAPDAGSSWSSRITFAPCARHCWVDDFVSGSSAHAWIEAWARVGRADAVAAASVSMRSAATSTSPGTDLREISFGMEPPVGEPELARVMLGRLRPLYEGGAHRGAAAYKSVTSPESRG